MNDNLYGTFDCWSQNLKFLQNMHHFAAIHKHLIEQQPLRKKTFTFDISPDSGEFHCEKIAEPMGDEPLEPLEITGGFKDKVVFKKMLSCCPDTTTSRPGYEGKLEWDGNGLGYVSPEYAKGLLKLRKV